MTNLELNIILRLRDEASGALKEAIAGAGQATDELNKRSVEASKVLNEGLKSSEKEFKNVKSESEKASKSIGEGMKQASKEVREFHRNMFIITAIIAAVVATTKEWSRHNEETKKAYDSIGLGIKETSALIGSLLAPAIILIAEIMNKSLGFIRLAFKEIQDWFGSLIAGFTYGITFWKTFISEMAKGTGLMQAYGTAIAEAGRAAEGMKERMRGIFKENVIQTDLAKIKLDEYKKLQQDLELLFKSGQITAQEYFNGIISGQNTVIEQNAIIADQARAYIDLAQEVGNRELMAFQASLQGRTDLFNTYKAMYMQGHADMFAFGNMLANEFHANMSTALTSIILGEKKAKEAFAEFGKAMLKAVVDYIVQQAIAFAISQLMQGIITATTSAMATTLAAAWAPAAALASLATMGGNAAPAIAGMTTTAAAAYAIAIPKPMAQGGEGIASRPTLFLAGEAGPERFKFTPLWKESNTGKQTINHISISIYNPVVRNDRDIDTLTEEISRRIALEAERLQ